MPAHSAPNFGHSHLAGASTPTVSRKREPSALRCAFLSSISEQPLIGCVRTARQTNLRRALRHMRQRRDAGVPLGCRARDGRRRELPSMLYCRPRESGSGFDALAFDGAVDRRAAHAPKSSATSRVLYSPLCAANAATRHWPKRLPSVVGETVPESSLSAGRPVPGHPQHGRPSLRGGPTDVRRSIRGGSRGTVTARSARLLRVSPRRLHGAGPSLSWGHFVGNPELLHFVSR
jgi:hypothetical protein